MFLYIGCIYNIIFILDHNILDHKGTLLNLLLHPCHFTDETNMEFQKYKVILSKINHRQFQKSIHPPLSIKSYLQQICFCTNVDIWAREYRQLLIFYFVYILKWNLSLFLLFDKLKLYGKAIDVWQ